MRRACTAVSPFPSLSECALFFFLQSLYADDDGLLPATFQVLYMIGWAPHVSQPKPLQRGTATAKLDETSLRAAGQSACAKNPSEETAAPFKE